VSHRPTLLDFEIALRVETRFHCCAEASPVGSLTEVNAMKEYEAAKKEAERIKKALSEYICQLEMFATSAKFDRRRQ